MNKVTNDDIKLMNKLYHTVYHTYAGVAREVGFAPTTVKKYIDPNWINPDEIEIQIFDRELPEFNPEVFRIPNWGALCLLTKQEKQDLIELQKELEL